MHTQHIYHIYNIYLQCHCLSNKLVVHCYQLSQGSKNSDTWIAFIVHEAKVILAFSLTVLIPLEVYALLFFKLMLNC